MKVKDIYRLTRAKLKDRRSKLTLPRFFETNELAIQSLDRALKERDRAGYEEAFNRLYLNIIAERNFDKRKYQTFVYMGELYPGLTSLKEMLDSIRESIVNHETGLKSLETELAPRIVFGGAER